MNNECIAGVCSVEKGGGALTHKHFQMMMKGNFTSLAVLNKKIKVCLGWHENPPTGHVRDEGLHTFLGMVGYCMKDNGEDHFEFVHHNVSFDAINEGQTWHMKSLTRKLQESCQFVS